MSEGFSIETMRDDKSDDDEKRNIACVSFDTEVRLVILLDIDNTEVTMLEIVFDDESCCIT